MEGGSCKSVVSDYLHETDMSGIRNKDVNGVGNNTNKAGYKFRKGLKQVQINMGTTKISSNKR